MNLLFIINSQQSIDCSLPYHSPITPLSILYSSLVCLICTVGLIPCLRGCKLEPSLKERLSCSCSLFSEWTFKNIAHWISISLTFQPQPTKCSDSLSIYHLTKAKRSKLPLSFGSTFRKFTASSSQWKPFPGVSVKSTTLKMEVHQLSHYLFYQILFWRLW